MLSRTNKKVESRNIELMLNHSTTTCFNQKKIWSRNNVCLGQLHRYNTKEDRLLLLPHTASNSELTIVADVRIDNRKELANQLGISKAELTNLSDVHLIIAAFKKWKYSCPKYLLGDFVFAIYEYKKQSIFLAKDPVGIKRLYFFENASYFAFASSVKSLMALPFVSVELNELTAYKFLLKSSEALGEATFVKNIKRLSGGHSLLVNHHTTSRNQYWSWLELPKIHCKNHGEYLEQAKFLFKQAVNRRLRTDKESVGFELSGGLDSSAVVCEAAMNAYSNQKVSTFSFMDKHSKDIYIAQERKHIEAVLKQHKNIAPSFIDKSKQEAFEITENAMYFEKIGYPFNHVQVTDGMPLYKDVREKRLNILLSGQGGDQCISYRGSRDIQELVKRKMWKELYFLIKYPPLHLTQNQRFQKILKTILTKYIPSSIKKLIKQYLVHQSKSNNHSKQIRREYLNDEFLRRNDEAYLDEQNTQENRQHPLSLVQWFSERQLFDAFQNIADVGGVTYRFPLVDIELIHFFAQIPIEFRVNKGLQCYLFRELMLDNVPRKVVLRNDKMGNINPETTRKTKDILKNLDQNIDICFSKKNNHTIFDEVAFRTEKDKPRRLIALLHFGAFHNTLFKY